MKKVRIISMLLALVTVLLFSTSCTVITVSSSKETEATKDTYPNHMNVSLVVYSCVSKDSNGNYIKLENEEDWTPIIGAPVDESQGMTGLSVGYDDGEIINPRIVLEQLAKIRKATLTFAGNNIDTIKMNGTTHRTASVVNTSRKGTVKEDPSDADSADLAVYYIDMVMWEWKVNGVVVENVSTTEIKDGDAIVLTLILDNTTKAENYKLISEYNAENGIE